MPLNLTGPLFSQEYAADPASRFNLQVHPWGERPTPQRPPVHREYPVSVVQGPTPVLRAAAPAGLTGETIFTVQEVHSAPRVPGMPAPLPDAQALFCRTGAVDTGNGFVPAELWGWQSPRISFPVSALNEVFIPNVQHWAVGVAFGDFAASDGRLVLDVQFNGWLGSFSGAATITLALGPAQVPSPGRFVTLELVALRGVGAAVKGAYSDAIRQRMLPEMAASLDDHLRPLVTAEAAAADDLASLVTGGRARPETRGVMATGVRLTGGEISAAFNLLYAVS